MIQFGEDFASYVYIVVNVISDQIMAKENLDFERKSEIITILKKEYSSTNFKKLARERFGSAAPLYVRLSRYAVEADKLNIFLVAVNSRKRAPVYLPVPKAVRTILKIRYIKTNKNIEKMTGFCSNVITKKPYTFHFNEAYSALSNLPRADYPEYAEIDGSKYNGKEMKFLKESRYITLKKSRIKNSKILFSITRKGQHLIDKTLGKLFDYPDCCITAFIKKTGRRKSAADAVKKIVKVSDVPEYAKFGLGEDFLPYYPCSKNCKRSIGLAADIKDYMNFVSAK
jgi:hypothetical protein